MEPILQFILMICIILVAAKSAGYLSTRLGQPSVVGELLIGLLLGPSLLNILHWPFFSDPHLGESVAHLAELGVLILMFIAGLEVEFEDMMAAGRAAIFAGLLGVVLPIGFGIGIGALFGFPLQHNIFLGLVLAATSVSISAQTLLELGVLQSRVGMSLLGAAVVDDMVVVLLLSVFLALVSGGSGASVILLVLLKMVLFIAAAILIGQYLLPKWGAWVSLKPISEGVMAFALVVTLFYSWSAEALGGMASITGAFLAGLMLGRTSLRPLIEPGMHTLAYAWLVPMFFVNIGLEVDARALGVEGIPFTLAIILAAILSKLLGAGLGGFLGGLNGADSLRLGVGMISRGEVGLIVAAVGLNMGLMDEAELTATVIMVMVTTLVTPIILRALYPTSDATKISPEGGT